MGQLNIFGDAVQTVALPPGLMEYYPGTFNRQESFSLMREFVDTVPSDKFNF